MLSSNNNKSKTKIKSAIFSFTGKAKGGTVCVSKFNPFVLFDQLAPSTHTRTQSEEIKPANKLASLFF